MTPKNSGPDRDTDLQIGGVMDRSLAKRTLGLLMSFTLLLAIPTVATAQSAPTEAREAALAPTPDEFIPDLTPIDPEPLPALDPSMDLAVLVEPSADGLGIVVAGPGVEPRLVASLRIDGFETSLWTGYACLTGNGRFVAATFGPAEMVNDPVLRDRGGFLAVIDLAEPSVEMVAERVALKYHSPGCGPTDEVAAVRHLGVDAARTEVLSVDAASGAIVERQSVDGQLTFPAPSGEVVFASTDGAIVKLDGGPIGRVVDVDGQAVNLRANNEAGIDFLALEGEAVAAYRLDTSSADQSLGEPIARGEIGTVSWQAGRRGDNRLLLADGGTPVKQGSDVVVIEAADVPGAVSLDGGGQFVTADSTKTASTRELPADDGEPGLEIRDLSGRTADTVQIDTRSVLGVDASLAAAAAGAASSEPTCAVPRNDPSIQVMQPSPEQVEWAVHRAVRGELNIRRKRNWNQNGLGSYRPQRVFPRVELIDGGRIPAQVLLGVLAQESNMWQAARGALPGVSANPIIGDYYGIVTAGGRIVGMDFDEADCGYGIGQITDHMRLDDDFYTDDEKLMIATDYAANIAVAQQILASKWNELKEAEMISPNADPSLVENWYMALWAYNTGFRSNAEHSGLGWTNNPANSDWRFDRRYFLRAGLDDAKTPGDWPYQERVLGFVETGLFLYGERAFTPIVGLLDLPLDPLGTEVSRFEFCTAANQCDPEHTDPRNPDDEPERGDRSFCKRFVDRECWWNQTSPFERAIGSLFGTPENDSAYSRGREPTVTRPYPNSCNGAAATLPETTMTTFPANAVIVDNLPNRTPTLTNCGRVQSRGSFEFELGGRTGSGLAEIDLHQLGVGYEGHLWYTHTNSRGRHTHEVLGRWTPPSQVRGWQRIMVHIPPIAADTYQADYRIFDGTEAPGEPSKFHRVVNQRWNEARWVDLGVFNLRSGAKVELSNGTDNDWSYQVNGNRNIDIAWDAIAFVPTGGPPDVAYVALGDSYTSGEGGEEYFKNSDVGGRSANATNACHRSVRAYSPLSYESFVADNPNGVNTYAFLACSGALTEHIMRNAYRWGEVPQLRQGFIDENTTHVSIGIGGNDAGFADVLAKCLDFRSLQRSCEDDALEDGGERIGTLVPRRIRALRGTYEELLDEVHDLAPDAQITLVGYPDVVNNTPAEGSICDNLLRQRERDFFDEMVVMLNEVIIDVTAERDFANYAHIRDVYQGHEACTDVLEGQQWINALTVQFCDSCQLFPSAASFHPNDKGHAAAGPIVYAALTE